MSEKPADPIAAFFAENRERISTYPGNDALQKTSNEWLTLAFRNRYMYHFTWLGRPIIQIPCDMAAIQEAVYRVRPDLIIETGIAHGGSLVFSASLLALLDMEDALAEGKAIDPRQTKRKVLGVDIDIRQHNRDAIEAHPMANWIQMIQGSAIGADVLDQVRAVAKDYKRILVVLDSNHTHEHVLEELELYGPLVSEGSYCLVLDTAVEDLPADMFPDRPWAPGDNPKTAVHAFQKILAEEGRTAADGKPLKFELDRELNDKLLVSAAPDGWLKRV